MIFIIYIINNFIKKMNKYISNTITFYNYFAIISSIIYLYYNYYINVNYVLKNEITKGDIYKYLMIISTVAITNNLLTMVLFSENYYYIYYVLKIAIMYILLNGNINYYNELNLVNLIMNLIEIIITYIF